MPIIYPADVLTDEEDLEFLESRIRHLIHLHNLISHWRFGALGSDVQSVLTEVGTDKNGDPIMEMKATVITEASPVEARTAWDALPQRVKDAQGPGGNPLFPRSAATSALPEPRWRLFKSRFWDRWMANVRGDYGPLVARHDPCPSAPEGPDVDAWVARKQARRNSIRWASNPDAENPDII